MRNGQLQVSGPDRNLRSLSGFIILMNLAREGEVYIEGPCVGRSEGEMGGGMKVGGHLGSVSLP
jgi:hypothetical protein